MFARNKIDAESIMSIIKYLKMGTVPCLGDADAGELDLLSQGTSGDGTTTSNGNTNGLRIRSISRNGLEDNIRLFGYINYYDAMQIVCKSKIGLCLLKPKKNYIESYPTKLFDYMQVGVPFVCSNFPLYDNLLNKCNAGVSIDPLNIKGISSTIIGLFDDSEKYNNLSKNGINALNKEYNWLAQENKLFHLIQSS